MMYDFVLGVLAISLLAYLAWSKRKLPVVDAPRELGTISEWFICPGCSTITHHTSISWLYNEGADFHARCPGCFKEFRSSQWLGEEPMDGEVYE